MGPLERIGAMMQGLSPAQVLLLVAGAGLLVLAIAVIAFLILAVNRRSSDLAQARTEAAAIAARLEAAEADPAGPAPQEPEETVAGEPSERPVWTHTPFGTPPDHAARLAESIPILALAGLSGGAGRTTLAANLATWFDARGERVLLLDLDHQGALGAMACDAHTPESEAQAPPAALLSGVWPPLRPLAGALSNSDVAMAGAGVAEAEARLLARWLAGDGPAQDLRYGLATLLLGPRIQTVYDRVIIDTPPRLTPGMVAALCAATHLLIPVRLDAMSVAGLRQFLALLDGLRPRPLPPVQQYRIAGIRRSGGAPAALSPPEAAATARIGRILAERAEPAGLYLRGAVLPLLPGLERAGPQAMAVRTDPAVLAALEPLGRAVAGFAPSYAEAPE